MSLTRAISDLEKTLKGQQWLKVIGENQEPGNAAYTVTIGMGQAETNHYFGKRKVRQKLTLTLYAKGKKAQGEVATYLDTLTEALIADRRRDTNAQTTLVGPWVLQSDTGREGLTYTSEVEVHYYAS